MLNSAPDNKLPCLIKNVEITEELTDEVVSCTLALAKRKEHQCSINTFTREGGVAEMNYCYGTQV